MKELRSHIDLLFEKAPKTRKAFELKEELYANSVERYNDLRENGVSEEDALSNVIESVGDVSELFYGLDENNQQMNMLTKEQVHKQAMSKTIAIGLYIFGVIIFFIFGALEEVYPRAPIDMSFVGLIVMLAIYIIPTCMLIYNASMYPRYGKQDDSVVEEFKEWNSTVKKNRSVRHAVTAVIWTLTLILYFIISFATMAWYITWIIFLAAMCAQAIVFLRFALKENK